MLKNNRTQPQVNFPGSYKKLFIESPLKHLRCVFAKIMNDFQLLTIFSKSSMLDVRWVLNASLLFSNDIFHILKANIKNQAEKTM